MTLFRLKPVRLIGMAGIACSLVAGTYGQTAKLKVRGLTQYIMGTNLPWLDGRYGNDFGLNPLHPSWGYGYNSAHVTQYFQDMKNMNLNVCRVWLCESLEGFMFDSNGNPTGLSSTFLSNLDNLVSIANTYNLGLYFTLFNGDDLGTAWGQTLPSGAVIQDFVDNATPRTDVLNNVIKVIAARYKGNNAVFGYDLLNESNQGSDSGYYTWANMRTFGQMAASAIHSAAPGAQVTMSTDWLQALDPGNFSGSYGGLGFDMYDIHYYGDNPSLENTSSMGADKPVLLGEYGPTTKTDAGQNTDCEQILPEAASGGWAGTCQWAYEYPGASDGYQLINSNASWRPICYTLYGYGADLATFTGTGSCASSVNPGAVLAITEKINCTAFRLSSAVVDLEVYNSSGTQVGQTWWTPVDLYDGQTYQNTWNWTVPSNLPAGTYTVELGVFGSGWTPLRYWNGDAKKFTVN